MKNAKYIKILALLFLALGMQFATVAQLSPGDLLQDHAHLEGMKNCTQCHTFGEGIPNAKCLACHDDINGLLKQKRGYHAGKEVVKKECISCHSDHHGRAFKAVKLDEKTFNHNTAGYPLEGAHKKVTCADCHQTKNIASPKIAKRKGTYLGMDTKCLACHDDFHQKTLSNTCTECHDMNAFKPATKFNHSKTKFALKGKHTQVDCKECHKTTLKNNKEFVQYTNVPHAKCTDCHVDKHNGQFGQNCLECHSENSFTAVKGGVDFDHSRTQFPLLGLHKKVSCDACHAGKTYTNPLSYSTCKSCHTDYHKGDFVKKNPKSDCKDCHDQNHNFTFTTYTEVQHNQSDFKLEGAHMATPCFACHIKKGSTQWDFSSVGSTCADCHGDAHKNQISEKFYSISNCTSCHSAESWASINFKHEQTTFALSGKHASASCRECHYPKEKAVGTAKQPFYKPTNDCAKCHENSHEKQFEINAVTDCRRCHDSAEKWTADKFEHDKTKFPLKGAHEKVDCSACHKPDEKSADLRYIQYKIPKYQCVDCHS